VRKQPLPKIVVSWDHQMDPNWVKVKRLLADFEITSQLDKQNKQTCGFLSGFPTPIPPHSLEKHLPWTSLY